MAKRADVPPAKPVPPVNRTKKPAAVAAATPPSKRKDRTVRSSGAAPSSAAAEAAPNDLQVLFGDNMRAARAKAGLTLRQMADLSGHTFQYLGKVERGQTNLTLGTMRDVAKVLGCEVSRMLRKASMR